MASSSTAVFSNFRPSSGETIPASSCTSILKRSLLRFSLKFRLERLVSFGSDFPQLPGLCETCSSPSFQFMFLWKETISGHIQHFQWVLFELLHVLLCAMHRTGLLESTIQTHEHVGLGGPLGLWEVFRKTWLFRGSVLWPVFSTDIRKFSRRFRLCVKKKSV